MSRAEIRAGIVGAIVFGVALLVREVVVNVLGRAVIDGFPLIGPLLTGAWGEAIVLGAVIAIGVVAVLWLGRKSSATESDATEPAPVEPAGSSAEAMVAAERRARRDSLVSEGLNILDDARASQPSPNARTDAAQWIERADSYLDHYWPFLAKSDMGSDLLPYSTSSGHNADMVELATEIDHRLFLLRQKDRDVYMRASFGTEPPEPASSLLSKPWLRTGDRVKLDMEDTDVKGDYDGAEFGDDAEIRSRRLRMDRQGRPSKGDGEQS